MLQLFVCYLPGPAILLVRMLYCGINYTLFLHFMQAGVAAVSSSKSDGFKLISTHYRIP